MLSNCIIILVLLQMRHPLPNLSRLYLQTEEHHRLKSFTLEHSSTAHTIKDQGRTIQEQSSDLYGCLLSSSSSPATLLWCWAGTKVLCPELQQKMHQLSASAPTLSFLNTAMQLRVHNQLCPSNSEHLQKKKNQNRYLLRSTPACAQATTTSASSKRKAEGDHIHITLQAEVSLIQSPLERSNSCSVGSVVLWICLATLVSPRSSASSFHLQRFFSLVSQNCPDHFKQEN